MENERRILTDADALDRVRKDIIILLNHQPFFAYVLTKTKKVIDKRVPVAGVAIINGDIVLYINPEGYLTYTKEERLFILIHEVMHIIFYHHARELKRDHGLWNVATDLAINQLIETEHAHMPIDCLRLDSWQKKHGFILPPGLSAEGYYSLLWEKRNVIDIPDHLLQGALGQHLADKQKQQANKSQSQPEESQEEQEGIQGVIEAMDAEEQWVQVKGERYLWDEDTEFSSEQGKPLLATDLTVGMYVAVLLKESGEAKSDRAMEDCVAETIIVLQEQPNSSSSSSNSPSNDHTSSGNPSPFNDLHPTWEDSTDVSEQLAESMARSVVQEAYKSANGVVPNTIHSMIQTLVQPKIQWKSVLHNFVAKRRSTNKKSTWKKQNRRLGTSVMGYKKNRKLTVVVAIDTSASISEEDFQTFYTEVINIHQNGATVILLECDAEVHTVAKFSPNHSPAFVGGGGTDFRPVFTAIEKRANTLLSEKPDAVIFFTDGYGTAPDKPLVPTLWCLTKNGSKPYTSQHEEIKWGSFVQLD